jgi:phosphoribosylglycinamide formyltransferase-1
MDKDFYLLLDTCVCCAYAVTIWLETFQEDNRFKGVLLREDEPPQSLQNKRDEFHRRYAGQRLTQAEVLEELRQLYPYLDEAEEAMLSRFGLPKYSINQAPNTCFLGKNINGDIARDWVEKRIGDSQPLIFSHLGQIVKPWWIKVAGGNLFNVHSAVLPYARGIYSIENVAASQDVALFEQSAGMTIHLIDEGVDTGPLLGAYRIRDPWQFDSIWDVKGFAYEMGYRRYADMANQLLSDSPLTPVPVASDPALWGPNFKYKDFTASQKRRAEEGYLAMKAECG